MPETITITGISRSKADAAGGQLLVIEGDFAVDFGKPMHVHVGPAGDATDPLCLAGVAGRGTTIYTLNATKLRCYLPMLRTGGPFKVYIRRADMSRTAVVLDAITVLLPMHYSSTFDLRGTLPPSYRTGPRNIELVDALEAP